MGDDDDDDDDDSASDWLFKRKYITMHCNMNVKFTNTIFTSVLLLRVFCGTKY